MQKIKRNKGSETEGSISPVTKRKRSKALKSKALKSNALKSNALKRAISMIMVFALTITIMPAVAAAVPKDGDTALTDYKSTLIGSDGEYFYRGGTQTSIGYNSDGSTYTFTHNNYEGPRMHYKIDVEGDGAWWGYCIEQGVSFPDVTSYRGRNAENDSYFSNLPKKTRTGIMLATIFGRQPGKSVPVSGCNQDDWYWATQMIIWEYQQKLRTSPTEISGNGHVSADYFKNTLEGRPAERCYNWMLSKMEEYYKIPSFTSRTEEDANEYVLKHSYKTGKWSLTLNDSNKTGEALSFNKTGVSVSKSGDNYTFSADRMITSDKISIKKDVDLPSHEMLIWGGATSTQAIITGTKDPVKFYMGIRTENQGTGRIVKTSEDDIKSGLVFRISGNDMTERTLITGPGGTIATDLYPGTYTVTEQSEDRYRQNAPVIVTVTENRTSDVDFLNIMKKGRIEIMKHMDNDQKNVKGTPEEGAVFCIYEERFGSYEDAPDFWKDEIVTDEEGYGGTGLLPYGDYIVTQRAGAEGTKMAEDFTVAIREDLKTYRFTVNNPNYSVPVDIIKTDEETGETIKSEGTKYKVRNMVTGEYITGHDEYPIPIDTDTFVTDDSGRVRLPQELTYGSYELIEVAAPGDYVLENEAISFVVDGSEEDVLELAQVDVPQKAAIRILKSGSGKDGSDKKTMLSGAGFDIVAAEDIITPDGTLRLAKGEKAASVITDDNGEAITKPLYLGRYEIIETKTPGGYVKPSGIAAETELLYKGQDIEVYTKDVRINNDAIMPVKTGDPGGIPIFIWLLTACLSVGTAAFLLRKRSALLR